MTTDRVRMTLPTEPAAYWRPDVNLSEVWFLREDGRWHHNPSGVFIAAEEVPDGLVLLGHYATKEN